MALQKRGRLFRRDGEAMRAQHRCEGDEGPGGLGEREVAGHAAPRDQRFEPGFQEGQVVFVLEHHADGAQEGARPGLAHLVKQGRGLGPFDGLGNARRLGERFGAQPADGGDHGLRRRLGDAACPHHHDLRLARGIGIVDPVIDAAPPQRFVQLARAVRRQDHDRPVGRADRAALRDRDLEVGQELQQKRLELVVGAVDLIDQEGHAFRCRKAASIGRSIRKRS